MHKGLAIRLQPCSNIICNMQCITSNIDLLRKVCGNFPFFSPLFYMVVKNYANYANCLHGTYSNQAEFHPLDLQMTFQS